MWGMKVTLNKDGTPRKSGSGRRKGATSFTKISLYDLMQICGEGAYIPVSRIWLEQLTDSVDEVSTQNVVSTKEPEQNEKISFTLHQ